MNRLIFGLAVSWVISAFACMADPVGDNGSGSIEPLFKGIVYEKRVLNNSLPMVVHIVTVDLTEPTIRFEVTPKNMAKGTEHLAMTTTDFLKKSGAQIAINASYFLPFAGGSKGGDDYYPKSGDPVSVSGAALSKGEVVSPIETDLDIRINAIVCFHPKIMKIESGQACPGRFDNAVAAGPLLLDDGKEQSYLAHDNNYALTRAPRTAIGMAKDGTKAWLVVVDGRQPGYSEGANLHELANLFLELGAYDALNLDGGGSSSLAVQTKDKGVMLLNRPIHTGVPGRERPVANHIIVFAKEN